MINIMSWNCSGAGARSFPRLIQEMKANYRIKVLIIIKPRVSGSRADNIIARMGYDKSHRVEAMGFSGGIWILWEDNLVEIDIISTTSQNSSF